ncbi:MAG: flagellar basal body rod protein FlgC [Gammaproteobacteria bacterium]|nr:flagellar basal body rod protein FlgC [Gammaproteobacteria bacterium]
MSMFKVFDIASSALTAQSIRMNTTASNLANANSVSSSIDQTYKARKPIFAAELDWANGGSANPAAVGVNVKGIVESEAPLQVRYDPNHPMANKDGYIYMPNVNVVEEMTDMIEGSRSYQSNVEVINTAKQLAMRTLSIGQN